MPHRRLAAIMFADIAGYTAMMQRNEQMGLTRVCATVFGGGKSPGGCP